MKERVGLEAEGSNRVVLESLDCKAGANQFTELPTRELRRILSRAYGNARGQGQEKGTTAELLPRKKHNITRVRKRIHVASSVNH